MNVSNPRITMANCSVCEVRAGDLRVETQLVALTAIAERFIECQGNIQTAVTFVCIPCFKSGMNTALDWKVTEEP